MAEQAHELAQARLADQDEKCRLRFAPGREVAQALLNEGGKRKSYLLVP